MLNLLSYDALHFAILKLLCAAMNKDRCDALVYKTCHSPLLDKFCFLQV